MQQSERLIQTVLEKTQFKNLTIYYMYRNKIQNKKIRKSQHQLFRFLEISKISLKLLKVQLKFHNHLQVKMQTQTIRLKTRFFLKIQMSQAKWRIGEHSGTKQQLKNLMSLNRLGLKKGALSFSKRLSFKQVRFHM